MAFQEEDPPGAPEWIVTFSDMISLLVTFFVLLLSFASLAAKEQPQMKTFLRGMWGVFDSERGSAVDGVKEPITPDRTYRINAATARHSRPFEDVLTELERVGLRENDERIPIDLSASQNGVRLTFGAEHAFQPGDAQVAPALHAALLRISGIVGSYPFEVVVEGYAESDFVSNERFASRSALALARATAAAAVLASTGTLEGRRVALSGPSDSPEADGAERSRDGRIELRLVPVEGL